MPQGLKSHQKGLESSDFEKSQPGAVVLPWMREIVPCIFSTRTMEIQSLHQCLDTMDVSTEVCTEAPVVSKH